MKKKQKWYDGGCGGGSGVAVIVMVGLVGLVVCGERRLVQQAYPISAHYNDTLCLFLFLDRYVFIGLEMRHGFQ